MGNYLELKTVFNEADVKSFPKWYMQSYLLGVPELRIGYRDSHQRVFHIDEKPVSWLIEDARKRGEPFDPVINMKRVYTILRALWVHFEAHGSDVAMEDGVVLHVSAKWNSAWTTSTPTVGKVSTGHQYKKLSSTDGDFFWTGNLSVKFASTESNENDPKATEILY